MQNQLEISLLRVDVFPPDAGVGRVEWAPRRPRPWVTLKGDVEHQYETDAAFDDVSRLRGVAGVTNEIEVVEPEAMIPLWGRIVARRFSWSSSRASHGPSPCAA